MLPGEGGVYTGRKVQGCCQGRGEYTLVEKLRDVARRGGSICTLVGKFRDVARGGGSIHW